MQDLEFKNAIAEDKGHLVFKHYFEDLTKKQKQIAFENAIKNNKGWYLLKNCFENLTEEEREICLEDALESNGWTFLHFIYNLPYEQRKFYLITITGILGLIVILIIKIITLKINIENLNYLSTAFKYYKNM